MKPKKHPLLRGIKFPGSHMKPMRKEISEEQKLKKRISKAQEKLHALQNPPITKFKPPKFYMNRGHSVGMAYTGAAAMLGPRLNPTNWCVYMTIMSGYIVTNKDGDVLSPEDALNIPDPVLKNPKPYGKE